MTVNTTSITSGPYTGNGVTTNFPYTFKAFTDANVIVYQTVGTSQSTLTLGTHYSVTGTGIDGGGNVVMVTAPASGDEIYIRSNYSAEQLTDFDSQGGFYPDTHEDAFDKQTMLIQQLEDVQGRGLRLPLSDSNGVMPELTPSPLDLLRWNAAGDAVENAAIETIDPNAFDTSLITQKIDTWADISTVTPTNAGQLFTLAHHTSGGLGGGTLMAFVGSVTDDGGTQKNCLGSYYLKRINYLNRDISMFGGAPTNTAAQNNTALVNAMNSFSLLGGGTLTFGRGTFLISQTITSAVSSIVLELDNDCTIDYSAVASYIAVNLSGEGSRVIGGFNGGFLGTASWDGTNSTPTYAAIMMRGNKSYVSTRMTNVRRVGIWFKDVEDGFAENCFIEANYPSAQWTGIETVNYGILFDPSIAASRGNFKAIGNTIKQSVQGIMAANYSAGQTIQGLVITGNIFQNCWNHGIYSNYTAGAVITGNIFNRCQTMVVISGPKNIVSGNASYTDVTAVGDERDLVGISARDAQGCIISNNTIIGTSTPATAVVIDVRVFDGVTPLEDNVVENNTITITAGLSVPIRFLSTATPVRNNRVGGNTIRAFGMAGEGAISFYGNTTSLAASHGNIISGNAITLLGQSHGIYTTYLTGSTISHNTVSYSYNSASAISVITVALFNCVSCVSDVNTSICLAVYGTNIAITGFLEYTGCALNRVSNSRNVVVAPATYGTFQSLADSNLDVNDSGTGTPSQTAAMGSMWRRTNGSASNTLYIKETINTSAVWRAIA